MKISESTQKKLGVAMSGSAEAKELCDLLEALQEQVDAVNKRLDALESVRVPEPGHRYPPKLEAKPTPPPETVAKAPEETKPPRDDRALRTGEDPKERTRSDQSVDQAVAKESE